MSEDYHDSDAQDVLNEAIDVMRHAGPLAKYMSIPALLGELRKHPGLLEEMYPDETFEPLAPIPYLDKIDFGRFEPRRYSGPTIRRMSKERRLQIERED